MYSVELKSNGSLAAIYHSDNKNAPADSEPITKDEFAMLTADPDGFGRYEFKNGFIRKKETPAQQQGQPQPNIGDLMQEIAQLKAKIQILEAKS